VAERRLHEAGFRKLGDLARASDDVLLTLLGEWGLEVGRLARGEDAREVEAYREAVSYSEENTFGSDIDDHGILASTILAHAEAVARRLRRDGLCARTVVLKWRLGTRRSPGPRGYPLHTRRRTFSSATDDGEAIAGCARKLLAEAQIPEAIRLLGVGVTNLEARRGEQLDLFEDLGHDERRSRINRALDEIVDRFGRDAVVRASQGTAERAGLSLQIKRGERSSKSR
jgi:DNA polymerase-4